MTDRRGSSSGPAGRRSPVFEAPSTLRAEPLGRIRRPEESPDLALPVVAVAGRSNVGKSTLLNRLLGRRHLFRTSRTPGCTRAIHLVSVASPQVSFVVADLPGYGYAALSRERRATWGPLIEGFLGGCRRLAAVLVLMDLRRGPEAEERQLLDWLASLAVPSIPVFTKIDKLPPARRAPALERARRALGNPTVYPASGETGEGCDRLLRTLLERVRPAARPSGSSSPGGSEGAPTG